jgi:hypothetical protein
MSLTEWTLLLVLVVLALVLVAVIVFCLFRLYSMPGPRRRGVHRG